jgi:hypothetical protein
VVHDLAVLDSLMLPVTRLRSSKGRFRMIAAVALAARRRIGPQIVMLRVAASLAVAAGLGAGDAKAQAQWCNLNAAGDRLVCIHDSFLACFFASFGHSNCFPNPGPAGAFADEERSGLKIRRQAEPPRQRELRMSLAAGRNTLSSSFGDGECFSDPGPAGAVADEEIPAPKIRRQAEPPRQPERRIAAASGRNTPPSSQKRTMSPAEREKLFRDFTKWQEERGASR